MLTLKNGVEIKYNEDFDIFFQLLLEKIVTESRKDAEKVFYENEKSETFNDIFLKELMDNAIYISHQLFEIAKQNQKFAEFIMSGFLFNSIIISMLKDDKGSENTNNKDKNSIH